MFNEITNLIATLSRSGALKQPELVDALKAVARNLSDIDYRSHMLGELSVSMAELGEVDRAEELARMVENTEKSDFLRRVAELEKKHGFSVRGDNLFSEAVSAVFLHRFPTQRAIALGEIAQSLRDAGSQAAYQVWERAIEIALKAQHGAGTDGPEAAGVLLRAVEALVELGKTETATSVANSIAFQDLREQAPQIACHTRDS